MGHWGTEAYSASEGDNSVVGHWGTELYSASEADNCVVGHWELRLTVLARETTLVGHSGTEAKKAKGRE